MSSKKLNIKGHK